MKNLLGFVLASYLIGVSFAQPASPPQAPWVALFFCPALHAQQNCNVEIKVLLSQTETQAAVAALGAKRETAGRVYFFDTNSLDLLSPGSNRAIAERRSK